MNTTLKPIKKPNIIVKFFWWAAGGDPNILMRSTHSDRVKYTTLGGIIVATGLMAALAGGYAFYTIFGPKATALSGYREVENTINQGLKDSTHLPTALMSVAFGLIWGLIIFNIDRFIVTSTGTGDGTEKITWGEFTSAIPRIVMGTIIAVTISKPVEIRMFKSEIEAKLFEKQQDLVIRLREKVEQDRGKNVSYVDSEIGNLNKQLKAAIDNEDEARQNLQKCTEKFSRPQDCPKNHELYENARQNKIDLQKIILPQIATLNIKKTEQLDIKESDEDEVRKQAAALDGLLARIDILHEIAPGISWFIMFLFLAIELTPIFFKLMLIKSPYDYLLDNEKELVKANDGIYIEYNYYDEKDHPDKEGIERHLVRFLNTERINIEKLELLEAQKRLTKYAVDKFEKQQMELIDSNPNLYIKIEPDQEENA